MNLFLRFDPNNLLDVAEEGNVTIVVRVAVTAAPMIRIHRPVPLLKKENQTVHSPRRVQVTIPPIAAVTVTVLPVTAVTHIVVHSTVRRPLVRQVAILPQTPMLDPTLALVLPVLAPVQIPIQILALVHPVLVLVRLVLQTVIRKIA